MNSLTLALLIASNPGATNSGICYSFEEIAPPFGSQTSWFGINDRNKVSGNYCIDPNCPLNTPGDLVGGVIHDLRRGTFETFVAPPPYNVVGAVKINDKGETAGQALLFDIANPGIVGAAAFLRDARGNISILPPPKPGVTLYYANSINRRGTIVGSFFDPDENGRIRGFIYRRGQFEILDVKPSPQGTDLTDINDWGTIFGAFTNASAQNEGSFVARPWGSPKLFVIPNVFRTTINGADDFGRFVGSIRTGDFNGTNSGFIKTLFGERLIDVPGAASTILTDINNRGVITGTINGSTAGVVGRPRICQQ